MKQFITYKAMVVAALACAFVLALAGCMSVPDQIHEETEGANAQRQYMAQLNEEMAGLQQVMDDFQVAVSEQNTVAMKAQIQKSDRIVANIEASEPTEELANVKELYVDALQTLNGAMVDYADLYMQVENSGIDADEFEQRIEEVQSAYDEGVEKLQAADDAVAALAQD